VGDGVVLPLHFPGSAPPVEVVCVPAFVFWVLWIALISFGLCVSRARGGGDFFPTGTRDPRVAKASFVVCETQVAHTPPPPRPPVLFQPRQVRDVAGRACHSEWAFVAGFDREHPREEVAVRGFGGKRLSP